MNWRYAACILSCHISDTLQVTVWQWEQGPAQIQPSGGDCGRCQLAPLPVTTCQMKSARSGPAATSLCTPLSPIVLTLEENVFNTEITIKNNKPVEVLLAFRAVLFVCYENSIRLQNNVTDAKGGFHSKWKCGEKMLNIFSFSVQLLSDFEAVEKEDTDFSNDKEVWQDLKNSHI